MTNETAQPTQQLLQLKEALAAAKHAAKLNGDILVTGKQHARDSGFEKAPMLVILVKNSETHWTVMWQTKIRRIIESDPFFTESQSLFVMEEYRKVLESNTKIIYDGVNELKVHYENELNDDKVLGDDCIELWASAQFNTDVENMLKFIEVLYGFSQYDILLKQNETKEFVLEINVP